MPRTRDAKESASRDTESEYLNNENVWFCTHNPSAPSFILLKIIFIFYELSTSQLADDNIFLFLILFLIFFYNFYLVIKF